MTCCRFRSLHSFHSFHSHYRHRIPARPDFLFPRSLLLLASMALVACGESQETPNGRDLQTWQLPIITVGEQELPEQYTSVGSITAERQINISSRISSYITELPVEEGEQVENGQVLAVLDHKELNNQISSARAAAKSAQAVLTDSINDVGRFEALLAQGSISEAKVRKVRLQQATAEENLKAAQAALALARSQSQYVQIRSPTSGIVIRRHQSVGDLATPGVPLLAIETRDRLKFETFVAESQLANISVGDPVQLQIDNFGQTLSAEISHIVYAGDPVTRSYKTTLLLPGQTGLYSGMYGRATFTVGHSSNVTIPLSALVEKSGLQGVYVVDSDNHLRFRWLRIRRLWPDVVEIASGLDAGERIVTDVAAGIREGDRITAAASNSQADTQP